MVSIYKVVGAPAVGKSTTSRALAARFTKGVHIPVDDIRTMVVAGLVLPSPAWGDDLVEQVTLARTSAVHMALAYQQAGFAVAIDDFWDPHHASDYRALDTHPHTHKILLYPGQDEAHQRNLQRSGGSPARAYIDEGIRFVYGQLPAAVPELARDGWVIVDTTSLSVEETVSAILEMTSA